MSFWLEEVYRVQGWVPVAGHHWVADDFCVLADSPLFRHRQTGRLVKIASANGSSFWLIDQETDRKNNIDNSVFEWIYEEVDE